MVASTATYAIRATDTRAVVSVILAVDVTTHSTKVWFVAQHLTDTQAPKIRVEGTINTPSTGDVEVDLDPVTNAYRKGLYGAHWEFEDATAKLWALPALGGSTLEILRGIK